MLAERPHLGVGMSALVVQVSLAATAIGATFKTPLSTRAVKIQTKLLILAQSNRFIFTPFFLHLFSFIVINTVLTFHIVFLLHNIIFTSNLVLFFGLRYNNRADGSGTQTSRPCRAAPVSYLLGGTTLTGCFFANYQLPICGFLRDNDSAEAPHFFSWALFRSAHSTDSLLARPPFHYSFAPALLPHCH